MSAAFLDVLGRNKSLALSGIDSSFFGNLARDPVTPPVTY